MNDLAPEKMRIMQVADGKLSFFYSIFSVFFIFYSISFSISIIPFLFSVFLTLKRGKLLLIEFLVIIVSYIVLYVVNRENFLIFTFRVLSYVNIFIGLSEKIDYSTIIDTLGSKGVPLVISIAYIPFFYRVSRELIFNMRARKVRFSFSNYVLPLTVQTIKVAEDLYVSYNLKLYGNLIRKRNFKPRKIDILLLIASVSVLLVSCVYNPHFLQIYNFVA
ncbi:hypothetical protein [Sulfolobus acidocaldarius]|uniref:Energy-coupling factor transporter transmembrane protein EcfT n=3 Tax=Sulfolobus acidocaldarius TaxID=2285 RepID=A0A0U3FUY5_9CREN|nr:hypothetical protein [Sulfolobus acidocaldarius]AGE70824.1 hypothetical protein SacN8_04265 [Sulfolobus acidocaldarius N8]AGE73095.1 hypothetical protein SacRon12I_04255 [Sulfolobus acidocaldarius Ron12/I]ALU28860.1 hypothetical protein ATY89_02035 [Sulfolobus acidocaldarius]ALU31582.1 hypothetical protein ATZ20_05070 [Sulfolobus acidocaldarius]WCM34791.1 hypothetical protein GO597_05320 [Sulfolobus acidocaldarius DSM 639]